MTPVETYNGIFVKRDDLCFPAPAPTFSKCRGLIPHLQKLKEKDINIIGYTETSISMAGWGVAWACKKLGMKAVIFDPQYKNTPETLIYHRSKWEEFGAEIIPIKAGMAKVNWNISKNILLKKYPIHSLLLPLGLPLMETIQETAKELKETLKELPKINTCIINVGSGTIASGIWKGMNEMKYECIIYGIMGRTGDVERKYKSIQQKTKIVFDLFSFPYSKFIMIDPGWKYTQKSNINCPFPCHPYYDLKAWQWLMENKKNLNPPILFWNIGS